MKKSTRKNRRRRFLPAVLIVAGAILLAAVLAFISGCGEESNAALTVDTGGRIQVADASFDFGSVPVDQQVEHEFVVKNTGTGTLQLGELSVKRLEGCWDAQAAVGSTALNPGESTTLKVTILMHKGMGGKHLFTVTIPSNDPGTAPMVSTRVDYIEK